MVPCCVPCCVLFCTVSGIVCAGAASPAGAAVVADSEDVRWSDGKTAQARVCVTLAYALSAMLLAVFIVLFRFRATATRIISGSTWTVFSARGLGKQGIATLPPEDSRRQHGFYVPPAPPVSVESARPSLVQFQALESLASEISTCTETTRTGQVRPPLRRRRLFAERPDRE